MAKIIPMPFEQWIQEARRAALLAYNANPSTGTAAQLLIVETTIKHERKKRDQGKPNASECVHEDAVKWNPYNHVVQCHCFGGSEDEPGRLRAD